MAAPYACGECDFKERDSSILQQPDSNIANGTYPSNGLQLSLNLANRSVKVLKRLTNPTERLYTDSQGSASLLPNGNTLLGYGSIAKIKEFGPKGDVRMRLQFGADNQVASYRAYRQTWEATPYWDPIVLGEGDTGYVSWNGDTRTTKWVVYVGSKEESLSRVGEAAKKGFETRFDVPLVGKYLQVAAYAGDTFLRNSSVVEMLQQ